MAHGLRKGLFSMAVGLSCLYVIQERITIYLTDGVSMMPTLEDEAFVLVNRCRDSVQRNLKRGDVCLCRSIEDPHELLIKRVTALEGDPMPELRQPINKFLRHSTHDRIPVGHVWIRGDNPEESKDSRDYGPVPVAVVEGRVLYQLSPKFKKIESAL